MDKIYIAAIIIVVLVFVLVFFSNEEKQCYKPFPERSDTWDILKAVDNIHAKQALNLKR
jgi:hypothetical protein